MKRREYTFTVTRAEIAALTGVGVDCVRMEAKKGTFDTLLGLCRWVVAKRLLKEK